LPKVVKASLWAVGLLIVAAGSYYAYLQLVGNPRVMTEIRAEPDGERAGRVMLIDLPDGRTLPVNYLREDHMVYVGVDGLWWRQFRPGDVPVELLIRGEDLQGRARAVLDDPDRTRSVFARLRPTAPAWLPGRMGGVLVEIRLQAPGHDEEG
jgi:hypothetical protein